MGPMNCNCNYRLKKENLYKEMFVWEFLVKSIFSNLNDMNKSFSFVNRKIELYYFPFYILHYFCLMTVWDSFFIRLPCHVRFVGFSLSLTPNLGSFNPPHRFRFSGTPKPTRIHLPVGFFSCNLSNKTNCQVFISFMSRQQSNNVFLLVRCNNFVTVMDSWLCPRVSVFVGLDVVWFTVYIGPRSQGCK